MKKFLSGMIFISVIFPLLNGFISIFSQWVEYICTSIAVKSAEKQLTLQQQQGETNTQCIGFEIPNVSYETEEGDE